MNPGMQGNALIPSHHNDLLVISPTQQIVVYVIFSKASLGFSYNPLKKSTIYYPHECLPKILKVFSLFSW